MCNFFSCICKKDKTVLWEPDINEHMVLLEKAGLLDHTSDLEKMMFARVEITPPNNDVFHTKISNWTLKIDERITPEWFSPAHKQACFDALNDCLAIVIVDGQIIGTVEEKRGLYIRDSIIQNIINCNICDMRGSSQIGEMWGSSQVGEMWDTSQIGEMWDTSQVGVMRESSQVGVMRESSQVGVMGDTSQIGEMWGSSQVGEMWDTSQIGEMWDTSRVGVMRGSSQIGDMRGSSQVGVMRESSQVGVMRESSRVGIYSKKVKFKIMPDTKALAIYCADKIQIIHATGTVIEIKEDT